MYLLVRICVRLCCICVIHLSHTHTDVVVVLFINRATYICVGVAFVLFFSWKRYYVLSHNNILSRFFMKAFTLNSLTVVSSGTHQKLIKQRIIRSDFHCFKILIPLKPFQLFKF